MSKDLHSVSLLSSYIHETFPTDPVTPVNGWVHDNFIPPNPVIPPPRRAMPRALVAHVLDDNRQNRTRVTAPRQAAC